MMSSPERMQVRIRGIVQGVGFRPFIFNLALQHNLSGWVSNDSDGVILEVEGMSTDLTDFLREIPVKTPVLARIDSIETTPLTLLYDKEFLIKDSDRTKKVQTLISPDMATCVDCQQELFDPRNKRYLYPFINCTNCGPRFTIIEEMPYDRPYTTMRKFAMCFHCEKEYTDPQDRRFHAQPNACPDCGPELYLTDPNGLVIECSHDTSSTETDPVWARPILRLRQELFAGQIAGVKGLGGYHLVCDALNEQAVKKLRERKNRPDKPLAVMMRDIQTIRHYCEISTEEERLLINPTRPIVLLQWKNKENGIAFEVAPAQTRLGVMLPYTPLHYLLFDETLEVLVMTSGNISGEPIIYDDLEAIMRLGRIVDYFLMHNRRIVRPCDDSVQRVDTKPMMLRRSRGYVPQPLKIKTPYFKGFPAMLAAGGELKNTFALAKGDQVFLSQHIGDLRTKNSLHHYRLMIEELINLFRLDPEVIVYDLHPGYLSTRHVLERYGDRKLISIQHHHAHLAGCMAEYGLTGEVIGLAFDGTGYGTDGKIWGGEFLLTSPTQFKRFAHLKYLPLPGGDRATLEPWRIGAAYLQMALPFQSWTESLPLYDGIKETERELIRKLVAQKIQTPETSSMGRFFDAVSAICGVKKRITYEGQAAIELEELAGGQISQAYPFCLTGSSAPYILDLLPTIAALAKDLRCSVSRVEIARRFHGTIVEMAYTICKMMRESYSLERVVLSGGVFQNRLLSLALVDRLKMEGFTVYLPQAVPVNDGGLAFGQIYAAGMLLAEEESKSD